MLVLIPAYEPSDKLLNVITEIKKNTEYKVLVIDDGSGEKYQSIFKEAEKLGSIVLYHSKNKGKGEALKTAFKYLLLINSKENFVCSDSDGQHHINDIIKIGKEINENSREMVLGTRGFEGKVPLKSQIGNKLTALIFRTITKINITDTQTGLRAYPNSMLSWLCSVEGSRFEYEFNLLLQAKKQDILIKQIPILTIYKNHNKGTHFHPIKDSIRVYKPLLKFCMSSFLSALLDFTLLFIFQYLIGNLFLAVVLSRIISSVFNYNINKSIVFHSKNKSTVQSAQKYFSLVIIIMILNYLIISFMINRLFINSVIAKLLAEFILFVLSYIIQKRIVFRGKKVNNREVSIK